MDYNIAAQLAPKNEQYLEALARVGLDITLEVGDKSFANGDLDVKSELIDVFTNQIIGLRSELNEQHNVKLPVVRLKDSPNESVITVRLHNKDSEDVLRNWEYRSGDFRERLYEAVAWLKDFLLKLQECAEPIIL